MIPWDPRALSVLERLRRGGFQAVLVGGCVRDSLLGRPLHDYDAATSARPEQVLELCRDLHCLETGLKHGTVTVLCGHLPVEVTTFRCESGYSDHRRPDHVSFTDSLTEDLSRRDYTINAIAWDNGALADPFGGARDLEARLVRCVGDPDQRFEEDALRPLRGLRLAAQLDFDLEPGTALAIRRHIPDLAHVSRERISAEFVRLLCSPGAPRILLAFPEAAAAIVPELAPSMGFAPQGGVSVPDLYLHAVRTLERVPPEPALRLAALLHDIGKPGTFDPDAPGGDLFPGHDEAGVPLAEAALRRLRLPKVLQERTVLLISHHHLPVEPSPAWARRWLARLGEEVLEQLLALKRADLPASAPASPDLSSPEPSPAAPVSAGPSSPCSAFSDQPSRNPASPERSAPARSAPAPGSPEIPSLDTSSRNAAPQSRTTPDHAAPADASPELSLLDQAEETVRACLAQNPCLTLQSLSVNGRDAMAAGFSGPAIGKALETLLDAVLEGELPNDRERLLTRLGALAGSGPA